VNTPSTLTFLLKTANGIAMKDRIARDFSHAAKRYDDHAQLQRLVANDLFALFAKQLTPEDDLLDIGCGTGYFQELVRRNKHRNNVIQTDIAEGMCAIARAYESLPEFGHTTTLCADMDALPLDYHSVARIFSSLAFQWSEDLARTIAAITPLLSPQGSLHFSTMAPNALPELTAMYEALGSDAPVLHYPDTQAIEEMLQQQGYRTINITPKSYAMTYDNARAMLRSLKAIGAHYKTRTPYRGKAFFTHMDKLFANEHNNTINWRIYLVEASL
jgi:malonyl-CoA O-methyltransferase